MLAKAGSANSTTRRAHGTRRPATTARPFDGPAWQRLPFRELGLAVGLAAAERLEEMRQAGDLVAAGDREADADAQAAVGRLVQFLPLRARIESFWLEPAHQRTETWTEHQDINSVMLATSVLPEGYLD